jgi:hypothetical protein
MAEGTKINVLAVHADSIRQDGKAVQTFVNDLLDLYYQGRIILLNAENQASLEVQSKTCGKDVSYIVNTVLSEYEIVIKVKEEKPKLEIDIEEKTVKAKKKVKLKNSFVNNY